MVWYGSFTIPYYIYFFSLWGRQSKPINKLQIIRQGVYTVVGKSPIMATLYYTVQPVLSKPKTVVVVVLKVPWETNIHKGHNLKFNEYCNLRTNQVKSKFICCLRSCEKYNLCIVYQNISAYLKLLLIHFYNVFQKLH